MIISSAKLLLLFCRLLKRSNALEFLQAQVATGGIVNLQSGERQSLTAAVQLGWISKGLEMSLQEAEKAYTGFVIAGYTGPVPLVEAIRVGIVAEMQGTRLLEAQIATGGLVDPSYGYRVPLDVAKQNGLIDSRVSGLLDHKQPEHKGYVNPETGKLI